MTEHIDAGDLALMAASFEAVMADAPGPGEADQALYDLGWGELLAAAPGPAAAMAFNALGTTGSAATLLDDVVAHALGLPFSPDVCVLFPDSIHAIPAAPQSSEPRILNQEEPLEVSGLVSSRIDRAATVVTVMDGEHSPELTSFEAGFLRGRGATGVDPAHAYRHLSVRVAAHFLTPSEAEGNWEAAVAAARVALAHQLIAGARWMLAEARQHALDRVQFGRPVASFQSIRHKLAESLAQIEGAASVAKACLHDPDPLLARLAKSLAGQAAITTATHAQQVLAGMGFTAEHRFHLWLKRMLVVDTLFGSANSLPAEIGKDLLTRGTVPRLIQL
ncbi:MAG: acyl-CoA dehydrogenase family protein [bacterium]|nr:acyl-CoA dehydrogenase family protein [bacterium]